MKHRPVARIRVWLVSAWPLVQATAAATTAWIIAKNVVGNHEPFFAPIAAVVALSQPLGERGLNAVRLLLGVIVGIVVGEITLLALEGGYGSVALATFAAMAIARALRGARLVVVQAAAAAILTVALGNGEVGANRLVDALIGGGVALVFSQFLFSPEPVRLVRRAESAALADMGAGLDLTGTALERDDVVLAEDAMNQLRAVRDRLVELERTRRASTRIVRHSVVWRTRRVPVVQENENAGQLDLLGDSCLLLTRTVLMTTRQERRALAPEVRAFSKALRDLADDPGDRTIRQDAVRRVLGVARRLVRSQPAASDTPYAAAVMATRMLIGDVMVFCGVDPGQAADAIRDGTGELRVMDPAPVSRLGFGPSRRHPPR